MLQIPIDKAHILFIQQHRNDDAATLMLNARKYADIDMAFAADQIDIRRRLHDKLPEWCANQAVVFPSRIASEQCSSSQTARYKSSLLSGDTLCDMTGGMGVDAYFFAQKAQKVTYIERFDDYCRCARHNFAVLGADNIHVVCGDCTQLLESLAANTFYIDPARRSNCNKRLFALGDCQPDIVAMRQEMLARCQRIIVKISPMADITETLHLLPETTEIHIISVNNECRELLFILENKAAVAPVVKAVNFIKPDTFTTFGFLFGEEGNTEAQLIDSPQKYLYEPNASILKSGAFKLVGKKTGCSKLHLHSHLYTSENAVTDFPGRVFHITDVIDFSSKNLKTISKRIPKANISTRNFPLTPDELRKKSGIADGGNTYLFATTCGKSRILIVCEKL